MESEWKEYSLTDLYNVSSGLSKPAKDFGEGYPFLSFKDVFYNYFLPDEFTQLVRSSEKERNNCSIKRGDVFLTRTSETMDELGMSSIARKDYCDATFNGFCKRLRPFTDVPIYPEFVGYFLRSQKFRNELTAFSTMSTRASLNNDMIGRLKITLPPLSEQKAIAYVLGSLDEKIELNQRMNETLEGMAKALFKSWFIDFDPVIDNALEAGNSIPEEFSKRAEIRRKVHTDGTANRELAKNFPNKFQLTEEMGLIPEGWELNSIYEAVEIIYGAPFKSKLFNDDGLGMPIIRIRDLKTGTPQNWSTENHPKATLIRTGDIVTGMDAEFRATLWSGDDCYLNQRLFLAKPKKNFNNLFIKYSISPQLEFEENTQVGTTVSHLGKKEIDKFLVLIPSDHITNKFNSLGDPILDRLISIHKGTRELKKIRDTLLPKLISGELRVPNAEKLAEEVL